MGGGDGDSGRRRPRRVSDLLETDGFVEYFEQATPITVIETSTWARDRPRGEERTVEDLRAIPWVFSWTQSRCIITGWYALGTGLQTYLDEGGDRATLREMYDEWPFFRTTLDNASLALARTDLGIAEEYADLADPELRERIYPRIVEGTRTPSRRCSKSPCRRPVRGTAQEHLERRNPYVDPLNLLQTASALADAPDRRRRTDASLDGERHRRGNEKHRIEGADGPGSTVVVTTYY